MRAQAAPTYPRPAQQTPPAPTAAVWLHALPWPLLRSLLQQQTMITLAALVLTWCLL
jgi:hypothetical protein